MSRDEALAQLRALGGPSDPEIAHSAADDILLELIDDAEITAAWEAVEKWFA